MSTRGWMGTAGFRFTRTISEQIKPGQTAMEQVAMERGRRHKIMTIKRIGGEKTAAEGTAGEFIHKEQTSLKQIAVGKKTRVLTEGNTNYKSFHRAFARASSQ